ncbi:MAG: hypothetical protein ACK4SY_07795 [Pyrobaculum sp.]
MLNTIPGIKIANVQKLKQTNELPILWLGEKNVAINASGFGYMVEVPHNVFAKFGLTWNNAVYPKLPYVTAVQYVERVIGAVKPFAPGVYIVAGGVPPMVVKAENVIKVHRKNITTATSRHGHIIVPSGIGNTANAVVGRPVDLFTNVVDTTNMKAILYVPPVRLLVLCGEIYAVPKGEKIPNFDEVPC